MDANALIERIKELEKQIEQSAANHNGLVGRLLEAKDLLHSLVSTEETAAEPIDSVEANPDN